MTTESFSLNPSCIPDACLLWIGPGRVGIAAIDSSNRFIKNIGYQPMDLYKPSQLRGFIEAFCGERVSLRKILVAFRLDAWCWIPTSENNSATVIDKWIKPFHAERIGHSWISDDFQRSGATAWVQVPDHWVAELNSLSAQVRYKHTAGFAGKLSDPSSSHLEITRIGDRCWFSLWLGDRFVYGQPHIIDKTEDLLYVLALLFEKFDLNSSAVSLDLTGEWEIDSDWLAVFRKHFAKIEGREGAFRQANLNQPGHWFTPLSDLLLCE